MQREVQHKVRGELRTDIQYYHRIVAVVIVSTPFPIPLGIRFQRDGEAEVACALALLQDLVQQLGRRFVDLLVGDARFHCEVLGGGDSGRYKSVKCKSG
jgi:hypothetical protein